MSTVSVTPTTTTTSTISTTFIGKKKLLPCQPLTANAVKAANPESTLSSIHESIKKKLSFFYERHKIPNIIFHGSSGSGKSSIVNQFIGMIYDHNNEKIKNYVMYVNCAHGKGIKFIRDELKFFAKTNINSNCGDLFKSIILFNADKLTMDAQSALRRCIELFTHTTRFFIVVEDKYKLLKPILSRFCEVYVPPPVIDVKGSPTQINLYQYNLSQTYADMVDIKQKRLTSLIKELRDFFLIENQHQQAKKAIKQTALISFVSKLYEKGYSGLDLIKLVELHGKQLVDDLTEERKFQLLIAFNKVKIEFRNEKWLMLFILNFLYVSSNQEMENISFM